MIEHYHNARQAECQAKACSVSIDFIPRRGQALLVIVAKAIIVIDSCYKEPSLTELIVRDIGHTAVMKPWHWPKSLDCIPKGRET